MFFELKITLILKESTHHLELQERIGKWISQSQLADEYFKEAHYDNGFKYFVFSSLYPIEKDGVYKQGRAYLLTIRSSQENIVSRMNVCMRKCQENEYFQFVSSEKRRKQLSHITEMLTINPVIVTIEHKPWVMENSMEVLLNQLHANAEKKFKQLYPDEKIEGFQPFIQGILLQNRKPIATAYKGRKLIGNKIKLFINEDDYSQKLADVVLGSGLGEKGSIIGAGFCLARCIN